MASDLLTAETTISLPREQAFDLFTEDMTAWWPREYTWSQDGLEEIYVESREGGFCVELGPGGFTVHWGRVEKWQPPELLVFTWQIDSDRVPVPDPAEASEVEVRFSHAGEGSTKVELEHRHFSRHGEGGGGYRDAMASERGWPYILERYSAGRPSS